MLILDTDHFSELLRNSEAGTRLRVRLAAAQTDVATTIITFEEQARGWLALVKRAKSRAETIDTYAKFHELLQISSRWVVLPWDERAADALDTFPRARPKVGTMDMRIAAIALAHDGCVLTRNLKDFRKFVGLKVENWLE